MLYSLGRGLQGRRVGAFTPAALTAKIFEFTSALPAEFTFTRSGATATRRDDNGDIVAVSSDTPRFDHDESGAALGLRVEPPSTNKCENYNVNPIDASGLTKGGDVSSVLSVVDDPSTLLADAQLDQLCTNGKLFYLDNSAGSSNAYVDISGEVGNTNPHSMFIYAAGATSGYNGNCTLIGSSETLAINATALTKLSLENETPNHSSRKIRVNASAGKGVYFILNQLEEMPFCTTPIIVQGASAARGREVCVATGLDAAAWFNEAAGAFVCEAVFDYPIGFDEQYAVLASEGAGLNNALGLYLTNSAASQVRARDIAASVNQHNDDIHRPIAGRRIPMGLLWGAASSTAIAGPMRYNAVSRSAATGLTNLYIGGRPYNGAMSGWVRSVKFYNGVRSVQQLGADMIPDAGVKAVIAGGQSNKHGFFRSTVGSLNSGEQNAIAQMDAVWGSSENWLINGAQNGSFAIKQNDPNADTASENWWYDPVAESFGPRMTYWEDVALAFGVDKIEAIDWDQGESDSASAVSELKAAWLAIFNQMRSVIGAKPVIITPIGRRSDFQSTAYNNLRQAQQELAAETVWIHLAPEKFVQPLADGVHLTDDGYSAHGTVAMRKILDVLGEAVSGGVDGPEIVSASRSGTAVNVTLSHNAGSDYTPSADIAGFKFFDNSSEISITSAVRSDATTITLTLASTPSGTETLYYGYGTLYDEVGAYTDLVRDNSTYQLPLRAAVVAVS